MCGSVQARIRRVCAGLFNDSGVPRIYKVRKPRYDHVLYKNAQLQAMQPSGQETNEEAVEHAEAAEPALTDEAQQFNLFATQDSLFSTQSSLFSTQQDLFAPASHDNLFSPQR